MEFTAQQIAELLKGTVEGNPEAKVNKLSKIEEGDEGSLTFLANPKYTPYIYNTNASIVIVNKNFVAENKINSTLVRVEDAYSAFAQLLEAYNQIFAKQKRYLQTCFYCRLRKNWRKCLHRRFCQYWRQCRNRPTM